MIDYPIDAVMAKGKTEYLYIAQEALRKEHNSKVGVLTKSEMKAYIKDEFLPRSANICQDISVERVKLSKADKNEIMGIHTVEGFKDVPGTKHLLIKSKRWSVDASKIKKVIRVAIG